MKNCRAQNQVHSGTVSVFASMFTHRGLSGKGTPGPTEEGIRPLGEEERCPVYMSHVLFFKVIYTYIPRVFMKRPCVSHCAEPAKGP